MNIFLQIDTSSVEALAKPQSPVQVFVYGVAGVFLFTLCFILCIKMLSYFRGKIKKRNNSDNDE